MAGKESGATSTGGMLTRPSTSQATQNALNRFSFSHHIHRYDDSEVQYWWDKGSDIVGMGELLRQIL